MSMLRHRHRGSQVAVTLRELNSGISPLDRRSLMAVTGIDDESDQVP